MSTGALSLTDDELLAFGGLARLLVRADGSFTEDEAVALEDAFLDLFSTSAEAQGPYRTAPIESRPEALPVDLQELLERAGAALPDEAAVLAAARRVTRHEAREAIFGVLYVIAASDVITSSEWSILDWLTKEWGVQVR
ncbi:MAG: hypothetical protein KIS78_04750 [Labilithrix sp.]|nr:hypothetical protein [Labilithrix sp.]MCW5831748.1 hypothetical protein [Labilithrix sp.]